MGLRPRAALSASSRETLTVKAVAVLPEYWETGAAIVLFAEMAKRAIAKGYLWADCP